MKALTYLFILSAKLLVTSGVFGKLSYANPVLYYVRKNEVIDLSDPTVTCESWIDFPTDIHGSIGALIGNKVLICGGALNAYEIDFPKLSFNTFPEATIDKCFAMTPSNVTEISRLNMKCNIDDSSQKCAAGVVNDALFVTGGLAPWWQEWDPPKQTLKEWNKAMGETNNFKWTEYVTEHSAEQGPWQPSTASYQCFIGINDTFSMLVGGRDPSFAQNKNTRYFNHVSQSWLDGPKLNEDHVGHACGKVKIDGKTVLVVAGSDFTYTKRYEKPFSVEFLPIDGTKWIEGPSLPSYQLPKYIAPHIVTNEDNLYFIDTDQNIILRLDCPSDLSSCQWIKMQQKLDFGRRGGVVALIPDFMASCVKRTEK